MNPSHCCLPQLETSSRASHITSFTYSLGSLCPHEMHSHFGLRVGKAKLCRLRMFFGAVRDHTHSVCGWKTQSPSPQLVHLSELKCVPSSLGSLQRAQVQMKYFPFRRCVCLSNVLCRKETKKNGSPTPLTLTVQQNYLRTIHECSCSTTIHPLG